MRARPVFHGTNSACQTLGGGRLDKAIAAMFLEAVTPAGVSATTGAISELERTRRGWPGSPSLQGGWNEQRYAELQLATPPPLGPPVAPSYAVLPPVP